MPDDLQDLPAVRAFGERLVDAARRSARPRRRWSGLSVSVSVLAAIGSVAAVGSAALLKATVISPVTVAPREQTPVEGSARVLDLRTKDPDGGRDWALRVARGATGLACTTVGQVDGDAFGIEGTDGVFRDLPESVVDACGTPDSLVGARAVAGRGGDQERSIVYGVVDGARRATAKVSGKARPLELGPGGSFVLALRGAPIDVGLDVRVTLADGQTRSFPLGVSPRIIQDSAGGPGFLVSRFGYGLPVDRAGPSSDQLRCALLYSTTRGPDGPATSGLKSPTACFLSSSRRRWVADARVLRPGDEGVPGFDRWTWARHPPRTVLWGLSRSGDPIASVRLLGAGPPRELTVSPDFVFGAVLDPDVDPRRLRLEVRFTDGTVQRGRPGVGLTPDTIPSRRPR